MEEARTTSAGAEPGEPRPEELGPEELGPEELGHPRGTLAIVLLYALLFALGWLGLYLFEFLPRGVPQP